LLVPASKTQAQDFTYSTADGTITITTHIGPGGNVTIPSTIEGLPVTSIGDSAFFGVTSLTGVTIPDSVTNLGEQAFLNCARLTSPTIGKGVTSISGGVTGQTFGTFMN